MRARPVVLARTADMLDVAFMGLHVAQMSHPDEMARCFAMVTETNAAIIGCDQLGLREGSLASLVVLDARSPVEAIRLRPARLAVISAGQVTCAPRGDASLSLPGRPARSRRRPPF